MVKIFFIPGKLLYAMHLPCYIIAHDKIKILLFSYLAKKGCESISLNKELSNRMKRDPVELHTTIVSPS